MSFFLLYVMEIKFVKLHKWIDVWGPKAQDQDRHHVYGDLKMPPYFHSFFSFSLLILCLPNRNHLNTRKPELEKVILT